MSNTRAWISSLRLRTLPLALSGILMGSFLAVEYRLFNLKIFVLTSVTAILLQILSNLANDYGDAMHGADNSDRIGPNRGLQSGEISRIQLRRAIILTIILALIAGCFLLTIAANGNSWFFFSFLLLGLLCIAAAIFYTVGKRPYGYTGLGDISVFIFFGLVAVAGTFYLYAHALKTDIFLPAAAIGFLSAGVLNINNMRDRNTDEAAGKHTLVVRIGVANAKRYHTALIILATAFLSFYSYLHYELPFLWLFLSSAPLLLVNVLGILKKDPAKIDKYLKQLAIATIVLTLAFGAGIILGTG